MIPSYDHQVTAVVVLDTCRQLKSDTSGDFASISRLSEARASHYPLMIGRKIVTYCSCSSGKHPFSPYRHVWCNILKAMIAVSCYTTIIDV